MTFLPEAEALELEIYRWQAKSHDVDHAITGARDLIATALKNAYEKGRDEALDEAAKIAEKAIDDWWGPLVGKEIRAAKR